METTIPASSGPLQGIAPHAPADGDSRAVGPLGGIDPRTLVDRLNRRVEYLRLSVTDRCNYRCTYCMPAEGVGVAPRSEILTYEEFTIITKAFVRAGVRRVRLTGGEPTLRKDLVSFVASLAAIPGIEDLAMTTNGQLLERLARPLKDAGLRRVNVSLDSLRPDVFARVTRGGDVAAVKAGIRAARDVGLGPVKVNAVVLRGVNDEELGALVEFAAAESLVMRFIEYMPIGVDDFAQSGAFVGVREMRERLAERFDIEPIGARAADLPGGGPATYWSVRARGGTGSTRVGFIAALSESFCERCNRVRLSADGHLRECLSTEGSLSLRDLVRGGASEDVLLDVVRDALRLKVDGHRFADGVKTCASMSHLGG